MYHIELIIMYIAYGYLISINQCFYSEQQAMASGYVNLSKLLFSLTIYRMAQTFYIELNFTVAGSAVKLKSINFYYHM